MRMKYIKDSQTFAHRNRHMDFRTDIQVFG